MSASGFTLGSFLHVSGGDPNISGADVRKATSDLNAAVAGLDWKKEIAKYPTVTVEIDKNGNRKWDWTPEEEQQVLNVVNEIYGSTDAHFYLQVLIMTQ